MERELLQANEFKAILQGSGTFPNDYTRNLQKELKLLSITGGVLNGEQLLAFLATDFETIHDILQWFKNHEWAFSAT